MIEFESVSKTYRDGTHAVSDLSLVVPSGKITVFVGPSGCGKTTTLRMVNRMLEPTSGRILWDGVPLKSKRRTTLRRQMGYVIQSGGLFPHRTVLENIGTVPGLLGWEKRKIRSRGRQLLDAVGLDRKLGDRYPAQLSGGQQQRVGVARALAADPMVMLMDEPFSAVDPVVRSELHEFFLGLQRELSKTIVLITHDIDEAIKLGDQVAILRVGGRLAQAGAPQELLEEPTDAFVEGFVGKDRGYRALSFMPASQLSLGSVKAVRDASAATGDEPVLLVDGDAVPQGWVDPARGGHPLRMGALFDPELDTLRVALDSALTSPVGLAVAVSRATGRYLGVVGADHILAQVADARAALDDPAQRGGRTESVQLGAASTAEEEGSSFDLRGRDETADQARGTDSAADDPSAAPAAPEIGPASNELAPEESAPEESAPEESSPEESAPEEPAPEDVVLAQSTIAQLEPDSLLTEAQAPPPGDTGASPTEPVASPGDALISPVTPVPPATPITPTTPNPPGGESSEDLRPDRGRRRHRAERDDDTWVSLDHLLGGPDDDRDEPDHDGRVNSAPDSSTSDVDQTAQGEDIAGQPSPNESGQR